MKVGVIKWFDIIKGFGVIITPNEGEFFLHKSNCRESLVDLAEIGTALVFEKGFERGKVSAKNAHSPNSKEDFQVIMELLDKDKVAYVEKKVRGRNSWGRSFSTTERVAFNVLEIGIEQFQQNVDTQTFSDSIKHYYLNEIFQVRPDLFIPFCQLLEVFTNKEKHGHSISENFSFFGQHISNGILFETWKAETFSYLGLQNEDDFKDLELLESVLWEKRGRLSAGDLKRIATQSFGERFCVKFIEENAETLNESTLEEFVDFDLFEVLNLFEHHPRFTVLQESLEGVVTTLFGRKLYDEYEKLSPDDDFREFENLFSLIPEKLPENLNSKLTSEVQQLLEEIAPGQLENWNYPDLDKLFSKSEYDYVRQLLERRLELFTSNFWKLSETLSLAEKYLTQEDFTLFNKYCFNNIPKPSYYKLWEEKKGKIFPKEHILTLFDDDEANYSKIDRWIGNELTSPEQIEGLLFDRLNSIYKVEDRRHFYASLNIIKKLLSLNEDWLEKIQTLNNDSFQFILWVLDKTKTFDFDVLKNKFIYLHPESQVLIIKKLFKYKKEGLFDLTIEKLDQLRRISLDIYQINENLKTGIPLDPSTDVIIESLKSYSEKGKFLVDSDLISVVLRNLYEDKKRKFKIGKYFEECQGRYEGDFNWRRKGGEIKKTYFGNDRYYFQIEFEYDESLVEEVRKLPGRKWNKNEKHWGVPAQYEEEVLEFAKENRFFLDFEGSNYENNLHLAEFGRTGKPRGITFCEGRVAQKEHSLFKKKFWWCANQPCFQNCETIHDVDDWENYTLLDFCKILDLNVDEESRYGFFPNGHYYQFVSKINRFNRLLERMYCRTCDEILYPIESSNYAAYTVVRFSCQNADCPEHNKTVYLNHCLNGKCNAIIDSRDSKRCHYKSHIDFKGLFICGDCGSCCSHEMLSRRLSNLEETGGLIHPDLKVKVKEKLGHLERAEYFCYKCGNDMVEYSPTFFKCEDCQVEYDLQKFKLNHPHKHLRRDDYPTRF